MTFWYLHIFGQYRYICYIKGNQVDTYKDAVPTQSDTCVEYAL